jgi:magnesium transporter
LPRFSGRQPRSSQESVGILCRASNSPGALAHKWPLEQPLYGEPTGMLTVFVFDERESRREEDVRGSLDRLADDALLWVALRDPTEEEVAAVQEAFELSDEQAHRLLEQPGRASLVDAGEHMHVTLYVASGEEGDPVLRPVECVLGLNWVVTAHEAEIGVLEEFRERAEGGGQIGALDSPSFVAAVVEWVVTSYFRAFEEVESELEELDAKVMSDVPKNVSHELARLVELRRSIGTLRRALAPHREVIVALAHPELDRLSTETSAERFAALESRVTQAVDAAREAKESTRGSFDLLVARIGQRTNDIMKLLTLVTVILLPASVLAGIMGMNFQVGLFNVVWMFWTVIGVMLGIAVLVLSIAHNRSWI